MDFFGLRKYISLSSRRQEQLERQKTVDSKLYNSFTACPHDIFEYIMKMRELNRLTSTNMYKASVCDIPTLYSRQIDTINSLQTFVFTDDVCVQARKHVDKINGILRETKEVYDK